RCPLVSGEPVGDAWVGVPGTDIWLKPADTEPASPAYFSYRRGDARIPKVYACDDRNDYPRLVALREHLPFKTQYSFVLQPAADLSAVLPGAVPVRIEGIPEPAFLSMFTGTGWIEVAPGRPQEDGSSDFGPCTPGLLYLPTVPGPLGVQAPAGPPFILRADGSLETLAGTPPNIEWAWTPPADAPAATPHFWKNGAFVPAQLLDRDGKRFAAGPGGALWLFWRAGPEAGGKGKPVGRPFVVAPDGVKEY
ncbi:MAG: hypothetical protein K8T20_01265, partial [Planctomycetes bacterium]|nr:hypothetical protein [Planctomycetota bacterium]